MFEVNFNLRYRRPDKTKVPDYSLPATVVFAVLMENFLRPSLGYALQKKLKKF